MTGQELKALIPDTATIWVAKSQGDEVVELLVEDVEVDEDGDVIVYLGDGDEDTDDEDPEDEE